MKFPTEEGIGVMAGDQTQARICYVQGVDDKPTEKRVNMIYQLEDDYLCDKKDARQLGELDPRDESERLKVDTPDDLTSIVLDEAKPDQVVKIGAQLPLAIKTQLASFLREFKDVFARTHADMPGIDPLCDCAPIE